MNQPAPKPNVTYGPDIEPTPLNRGALIALAIAVLTAAVVALVGYRLGNFRLGGSDFDQLWFAARAVVSDRDPYALIGPGRTMDWGWPFVYPLTSAVGVLPLAWMPVIAARVVFAGVSAFALAYALGNYGTRLLPIMLSASFVNSAIACQWPPLITAALLMPTLAFVYVFKPNIGIGLLTAAWSRRQWIIAGAVGIALLVISLAFDPGWPQQWRTSLSDSMGITQVPAVTATGGPLLLLAVFRWRRWDARLLLVLSVIPQTPAIYSALPVGLLSRTSMQALLFCAGTHLAQFAQMYFVPRAAPNTHAMVAAACLNLFVYLPWLVVILSRPNPNPAQSMDTVRKPNVSPAASS